MTAANHRLPVSSGAVALSSAVSLAFDLRSLVRRDSRAERLFLRLLCVLAATLPLEYLFGGYDYRTGAGFRSPSYLTGLVILLGSLFFLPELFRLLWRAPAILFLLAAFLLSLAINQWLVLSGATLLRHSPREVIYGLSQPFKMIAMSVFFLMAADRPRWRRRVVVGYMTGWFLFVLYSIYLSLTGQIETVGNADVTRISVMRMNENEQSIYAASGMVILLMELLETRRTLVAALCVVGVLLGGAVFLLGASRSALVVLVVTTLLGITITCKTRTGIVRTTSLPRLVAAAVLIAVGSGAVLSSSELARRALASLEARISASLHGEEYGSRDQLAARTFQLAAEHPFGVGLENSHDYLDKDPHNGYLKMFAEAGVSGGLLMLIGLGLLAVNGVRWARVPGNTGPLMALAMFAFAAAAGQALEERAFWFCAALFAIPPEKQGWAPRAAHGRLLALPQSGPRPSLPGTGHPARPAGA
jgi:O-antigen ligase